MRTLLLTRMDETLDSTVSVLWALNPDDDSVRDAHLGFVIEDGMRAIKDPGKTRIPAGTYLLKKRTYGRFFEKYRSTMHHEWVPELVQVPGYADILIHLGNFVLDTRGCLLPNTRIAFDATTDTYYGEDSRGAYTRLYRHLEAWWNEGHEIQLVIKR